MFFWYLLPVISVSMLLLHFLTPKNLRLSSYAFLVSAAFLFCLVLPLYMAGNMGVDYTGYLFFYRNIPSFTEWISGRGLLPFGLEPGYQFIVMVAKSLGLNERGPVSLLYLISVYALLKGCRVASISPLAASAFFILLIYPEFYGQQRMAAVYSFGVLIIAYLSVRNLYGVVFTTLISALIQYVSLAYLACILVFLIDNKRILPNEFLSKRVVFSFGNFRKYFSKDMISFLFFPVLFGLAVIILVPIQEKLIIFVVEQVNSFLGGGFPITGKFLEYYYRNTAIDISYLGILATCLLVLFVLFTYTAKSGFFKIRYGVAFLILSVLFFGFFAPLPFVSYRVVLLFSLVGFIYVGSIIISKKPALYITPVLLISLVVLRYVTLVVSLGRYSF